MARDDEYQSPENQRNLEKRTSRLTNAANMESLLSPRFRSAAAMAGWDEETLLLATMIVEDTPEREPKNKRRINQQLKTPPARRKRRSQQQNPSPIPVGAICVDDEERDEKERGRGRNNAQESVNEEKKKDGDEGGVPSPAEGRVSSLVPALPCMDRLREELSCAICLEICFEPSTTTCGHSFCKKCLKSAADKCGKRCPKCRQLISNGRSCTVNTVLWNTIQLLFPDEVEARKTAAPNALERKQRSPKDIRNRAPNLTTESAITSGSYRRARWDTTSLAEDVAFSSHRNGGWRRSRRGLSQDEDAALAFRLQREEFMEAFGGIHDHAARMSLYSARSNLRAMASGAAEQRHRGRRPI